MKSKAKAVLRAAHAERVKQGLGNRKDRCPSGRGAVTERFFREQAALADWRASKRGWPDFILQRDGQLVFVETKSEPETALKREQQAVAEALAGAGFIVFRWDPVVGFQQIAGEGAAPPW